MQVDSSAIRRNPIGRKQALDLALRHRAVYLQAGICAASCQGYTRDPANGGSLARPLGVAAPFPLDRLVPLVERPVRPLTGFQYPI